MKERRGVYVSGDFPSLMEMMKRALKLYENGDGDTVECIEKVMRELATQNGGCARPVVDTGCSV